MKKLTFTLVLFFSILNLFAQEIDLDNLDKIPLETKDDIAKFDKEVIPYLEWMETHSLNHEKRIFMNRLLLMWIEGTSSTTVTLNSYIMDYTKKNNDFLMLFLGGWAKHMLQNPDDTKNDLKGNMAGMNSILNFYEKGKAFGVKKDKKVEKLLKVRKSGKLDEFIKGKI